MIMTRNHRHILILALLMTLPLALGACGAFGGKKKDDKRLTGERIAVLEFEQGLTVDPALTDVEVRLPRPYTNRAWPQRGGYTSHALHHLALGGDLRKQWDVSIGDGSGKDRRLTSPPVMADGKVFTLDTEGRVSAFNADSGRRQWSNRLDMEDEKRALAFGGGLAYADGRVYVNTGYGFISALDAGSGREIWREFVGVPLRGSPTVAEGRVFTVTYDNQLYALDAADGSTLWYHVGIAEDAGMMGTASPAVQGELVVAAFSSGELVALRVENGNVAWTDSLTRTGRLTPLASINDIDGQPVIDRGQVFAISHGGRMVAIDMRTGERIWENNIGGIETPWVAGDFIYLVSTDSEVVCLSRRTGRIRWIRTLQRFENQKKKKGLIHWNGPLLVSDRLLLTSSNGYAVSVSPYDGRILGARRIGDEAFLEPIVAQGMLYQLNDNGKLVAYR